MMGKHSRSMRAASVLSVCGLLLPMLVACKDLPPVVAPANMPHPKAKIVGPQPVASEPTQKQDTGTYPTFAKPMTAAMPQMEENESTTMEQNLTALGKARRSGQITEAEYNRRVAELRKLAENQQPTRTPPPPTQ